MKLTKKRVLIGLTSAAIAAVAGYLIWEGIAHPPTDLTKLLPAFTTASAEIRDQAAKAVSAGKAKDYATAVEALGAIVNTGTLSEDQKQALIFTLTEIRRKVTEASRPDTDLLDRIDELTLALID